MRLSLFIGGHDRMIALSTFPGTIVNVQEVARREDMRRVRARIAEPEGWISLENLDDGLLWAERQANLTAHACT